MQLDVVHVHSVKGRPLARFQTTSHFDREYLRNGTRYRQLENVVANYDLSRVCCWSPPNLSGGALATFGHSLPYMKI